MCKVQRGTLGVDMTWYMDFSFKKASDRDTEELILTPMVSITFLK